MQFTVDLSGLEPSLRQAVIQRCRSEDKASYDVGRCEQLKLKQTVDRLTNPGCWNACGPMQFVMSPDQHQRAMARYGQLCFMDPDFTPWLLKRHGEDMRVKDVRQGISQGWTPGTQEWKQPKECGEAA